ncbi:hypothetical protein [Fusobacterium periodonticum]|uniref:Uncharacterized protein n=1 Tax=Fusobacterium periodonticum ATCC 33693 TaxID=546275 RepID=D4CWF2_9FUSO|nr:hypothetical protein [Fusobacterium periodonticum]EFE86367.1 hypothetical protein FUSPEROL_01761 [Fusobacterium periodonticum ATCC 33693]
MDLIIPTFFITILFAFSLLIAFIIRKILIEKAMLLEIDEDLKNLAPKEFFLNILKREKFSKTLNYVEFFFFLLFTIFIVFQGYQEYILFKEHSDSSINLISFILHKFSIPVFLWLVVSANLLLALLIRKRENKRIYEMLDKLEKSELLKSAQVDFLIPNNIIETGLLGNDIKFGSKFLFLLYPGYIIPYCWLNDVKIIENPGRYGSKSHYVNIILKTSSKPINITFAKKEICEKIRDLLLKKKYKSQKIDKIYKT